MMPSPNLRFPNRLAMGVAAVVLACPNAFPQPAPTDPRPGLVAHWSFDRIGDDLAAPDLSPFNRPAVVDHAVRVKGVSGTALEFDGLPGGALARDFAVLDELTLDVWFKTPVAVPAQFATLVRSDGAFALRFGDNGQLGFLRWLDGNPTGVSSTRKTWEPDRWYHVAATWDGREMQLFIDGEPDAPRPIAAAGRPAAGGPVGIGACAGRWPFKGTIDEVRVFSRALSPREIAAAHREGLESIRLQADRTVAPEPIGKERRPFRKPPRETTMTVPGLLWIDAEDFAEYGGWTLDTQFVHLMGSAYLLATGVGTPVKDATTSVDITTPGTYTVWVRARNWVPEHAPGRFRVLVNGTPLPAEFGAADTGDWVWERGGTVALEPGTAQLALHDLTGYYGRCDAIVFAADPTYVPPAERDALCRERARLTGLSLAPQPAGEYDVIVVGAGAAGSCAALAAARTGARTALIQNRPVLGGNSSSECGVPLNGAAGLHPNARETGIPEEVARLKAYHGAGSYSEPFRMLAEAEPNLSVFLNAHVFAADMETPKQIASVRAVDTLTGEIREFKGRFFIDCTGDGWVGYFAKADFRLGRESRDEFDESLAPPAADTITMSGCIMGNALGFRAEDAGKPTPFTRPAWAPEIPPLDGPGRRIRRITGGEWWLEHPGDLDDIWEAEHARDMLIRISFSYWDYIKNRSEFADRAATYHLTHIPHMDAKRESRRLLGDVILTQNDCTEGRVFEDRIAYGGWPLDVHHPKGIFSGPEGSFDCNAHVPIYTIPFRSCYSRNVDNLLFAGRCMSVTHIALGTVRVQNTLATIGQAVGTAAGMCVARKTTPRGLYEDHLRELQQTLLRNDQSIPAIVNEDPADKARSAAVSASSTAEFRLFEQDNVKPGDLHPLDHDRAMTVPFAGRRLDTLRLLLASTAEAPVEVRLHVAATDSLDRPAGGNAVTDLAVTVPPGAERWIDIPVGKPVEGPFVTVWVEKTEGVSWRLMDSAPEGCARAYGNGADGTWIVRKGEYYAIAAEPPLRAPTTCRPENVTNGRIRVEADASNVWASAPDAPLPQWIELAFPQPETVSLVQLTFDTNAAPRIPTDGRPPECVRDYRISCHDGTAWRTVAEVTGNFMRRRVHRFSPVTASRIRVTVTATNGEKSARIFEIRAYNE